MAGLMVARVGLGVFEAGFGPGIPLYFCKFLSAIIHVYADCYQRYFISRRKWASVLPTGSEVRIILQYRFCPSLTLGLTGAALAGSFGGLSMFDAIFVMIMCSISACLHVVAYGVQQVHSFIENWRILFIIEVNFRLQKCTFLYIVDPKALTL